MKNTKERSFNQPSQLEWNKGKKDITTSVWSYLQTVRQKIASIYSFITYIRGLSLLCWLAHVIHKKKKTHCTSQLLNLFQQNLVAEGRNDTPRIICCVGLIIKCFMTLWTGQNLFPVRAMGEQRDKSLVCSLLRPLITRIKFINQINKCTLVLWV